MGLSFTHVQVPEIFYMGLSQNVNGTFGEDIFYPVTSNPLFETFKRNKSVKGMFQGHDHNNNYEGVYEDMFLCYS